MSPFDSSFAGRTRERSAGCSCMTMIDDQTVGILYEGSQAHMTFQRIPLSDILSPRRQLSEDAGNTVKSDT